MMLVTAVSENVAKQVCAIDHFIGKYSFLLINQFVQRKNFLILEYIPRMRLLRCRNSARTDLFCAVKTIFKLPRYLDDQTFTQ